MNIFLAEKPDIDLLPQSESKIELQEPSLYNIVLLNDDYTPMDFVIEVLMHLFSHKYESAYDIMMMIHHQGRGIAGTFTYEIALEKIHQVTSSSQANEFPLTCEIEPA